MKKIMIIALSLAFAASLAYAAEAPVKAMELEGTIIDNQCATANKANLPEFIKTHPKSCALMPNCAASGYSLYMPDGSLKAFDKASNAKIEKFLKTKAGKLEVNVKVKETGSELNLVSIKNMKKAMPEKKAAPEKQK